MKVYYFIIFNLYYLGLSLAQSTSVLSNGDDGRYELKYDTKRAVQEAKKNASLFKRKGGCGIRIETDLPKKFDPVYLVKDSTGKPTLALPNNDGNITLVRNQDFILSCTGGRSTINATGTETSVTQCLSGTTLIVDGKQYSSIDLDCTSRSLASLLLTNESCYGQNTNLIQSGFQVENDWFSLIDTCHNINEANSLWSRHILYGTKLAYKVSTSDRPGFSRGNKELYKGFDPNVAYKQSNQEAVFADIYGNKSTTYINSSEQLYLARGHLSPDADFLYASWQMLTYFYINAAPQWQKINGGHWLAVENNAREISMKLKADLIDTTGTYGTLSLADSNGTMKNAYLAGNRLPVPELLWKFLRNPTDNSCIVLIVTNNPFLESPPKTLCPDVCSSTGWPVLQNDFKKGYVYCCDYNTFKAAAPQVPLATCSSTLNFQ